MTSAQLPKQPTLSHAKMPGEAGKAPSQNGGSFGIQQPITDALVGRIINNTYEIKSVLGTGGMGVVYLATNLSMNEDCAIKVLTAGDSEISKIIVQEARAMKLVEHPNIVRIHDVGSTADRITFIAMEYLQGTNMAAMIRENGEWRNPLLQPLPLTYAVR